MAGMRNTCSPVSALHNFSALHCSLVDVPPPLAGANGGQRAMPAREGAAAENRRDQRPAATSCAFGSSERHVHERSVCSKAACGWRYKIAIPSQPSTPSPSAHVRFRLGAVCGARRRWKDRARQRPAEDRRSAVARMWSKRPIRWRPDTGRFWHGYYTGLSNLDCTSNMAVAKP